MRYAQPPPTKAATAVYVTLTAQVLSLGALVLFELTRADRLAEQLAAFGGRPSGADAEAVVGAVTLFAVLIMLLAGTTIASAAAYTTWLVRARQANDRTASPRPVVLAWMVPGVNLLAPALLLDQVWRAARPPLEHRDRWRALLAAWWVSWLVMLALVVVRLPLDSSGGLTGAGVPELVAFAVSAVLCAATVRTVTRVQCSHGAELHVVPRSAQIPPAPESAPIGQAG
ncbi:DUF4328 domain-containing protein [Nonomuraea indica]|uniref:DUF4328 domain-containing protein n=1 Tax=Nonomuraea indica TaxID=1581193 RepID=A0ABW8AFX8_9ACTN